MGYIFPAYKVAAVQAASVFLDRERTTDKACALIREAARNGARLVVFPETYIAGYPHWTWLHTVKDGQKYFNSLVKSSVTVPSPTTDLLCAVARECDIYVAMGLNETSESSFAEIFNTMLLIDPTGRIIGKHRKLMPTFFEKLVWSFGDGKSLRTYDTEIGRLGMLICGENGNPLARFALTSQAEQVHIASFPAFPQIGQIGDYSVRKATEIRAAAHSFEGKVFTIVSSSIIDDGIRDAIADRPEYLEVLKNGGVGLTAIYGPSGMMIAGPIPDNEEGIAYADINLEEGINWKIFHDYNGNYNRFDVLSLNINDAGRFPLRRTSGDQHGEHMALLETVRTKLATAADTTLTADLQELIAGSAAAGKRL